jgi:hypothetical protein
MMAQPDRDPQANQWPGQAPLFGADMKSDQARRAPSHYQPSHHLAASKTAPIHANITSYPHTEFVEEPETWQNGLASSTNPVTSPGSMHITPDIYHTDEDTSHRDSSFDDLLTNEASSENPLSEHTTPQETIWEREFMIHGPSQPHILDPYNYQDFVTSPEARKSPALAGMLPRNEEQLPQYISGTELWSASNSAKNSPQIFPTAGELPLEHQQQLSHTSYGIARHTRSDCHNLRVDTRPDHNLSPGIMSNAWHNRSQVRAPSPVVMVSDYENPAPKSSTTIGPVPSSGKRGRESDVLDQEDRNDNMYEQNFTNGETIFLHLQPPGTGVADSAQSHLSYRAGVDPQLRDDEIVPSLKQMDDQRQLDERNDQVQEWLAANKASGERGGGGASTNMRRASNQSRPRAHTHAVDTHRNLSEQTYSDRHIPGPGVLVDVESDNEYFDDASVHSSILEVHTEQILEEYLQADSPRVSPTTLEERGAADRDAFPALDDVNDTEDSEPDPKQFLRRGPWQDPFEGPIVPTQSQPSTSNAAAYRYNQEAAKFETSSRAATWGTRRRLSESEVNSIVDGSQVRHLSLSQKGRERGASLLNKARGILPRRSSSNIKADPSTSPNESSAPKHGHKNSIGSLRPNQRMPSFGKPKSPPLNTGSALLAMTGQLAAVGRGNSVARQVEASMSSTPTQPLKKQRSRSDVSKGVKSPNQGGLADLLSRHGGPPIPTLASPMHEREPIIAAQMLDNEDAAAEDDDDDIDEHGIKMDLDIRAEDITPSTEGFRDHARRLNPRLLPYMIDRIGQEQIRRYKKLVEAKIKHKRSVKVTQKCSSGKYCFELGGEAVILASRADSRDPEATSTQFQVTKSSDEEVDESGFTEGVVTPALFPPGIPLPPVQRLPAVFECNLCFRVKEFKKPSDWTKHVHEDVQPFSCTFPNCSEPKSFKRKADWVRHENERHRHLEWWRCSVQECNHICYRKDNFIQHLVREHKMPESKVKRGSASSKNKPVNGSTGDNEVDRLVYTCRAETQAKAKEEPCRFCGNVCSSFKKLSVHMGKHMEQLAMPVLALVNMKEVSPDTIISPIEQQQMMPTSFAAMPSNLNNIDPSNLSPYPHSATSLYQTSSAGQSPASLHGHIATGGQVFDGVYYGSGMATSTLQGQGMMNGYVSPASYQQHSPSFLVGQHMSQRHDRNYSPQNAMATPRSSPMNADYGNAFYTQTSMMYGNPAFGNMYGEAQSHIANGYGSGQDASSLLQNQMLSESGAGVGSVHSGVGLQTQMDEVQQHPHLYGGQMHAHGTAGAGTSFT